MSTVAVDPIVRANFVAALERIGMLARVEHELREHHGVLIDDVLGWSNKKHIVLARRALGAFFFARGWSVAEVSRLFGRKAAWKTASWRDAWRLGKVDGWVNPR